MNPRGCLLLTVMALTAWPGSPSAISTRCRKTADVVFALDSSSSIWPVHFRSYVLPFVQNVVSLFDVGPKQNQVRVGVVSFSDDVTLEFPLNVYQDKASLLAAIARIQQKKGNTYTHKALSYVSDNMFDERHGGRPDVTHIVVLITDGYSFNPYSTAIEAENLRQNGAVIFAIGVGNTTESELEKIASQPSRDFRINVTDSAAAEGIKRKLALQLCKVITPYIPNTSQGCDSRPVDVTFAFDASSLSRSGKNQVIYQIKHLTFLLSIMHGDIKVGITSGPGSSCLDSPPVSPQVAIDHFELLNIKSNIRGVVDQWQCSISRDQKPRPGGSSRDFPKKVLIILLNRENVEEINDLAKEIRFLVESGVEVMVVMDESVDRREVDRMIQWVGHHRVLSGDTQDNDYFSSHLVPFICPLSVNGQQKLG